MAYWAIDDTESVFIAIGLIIILPIIMLINLIKFMRE